jgi:hypothetical protein
VTHAIRVVCIGLREKAHQGDDGDGQACRKREDRRECLVALVDGRVRESYRIRIWWRDELFWRCCQPGTVI